MGYLSRGSIDIVLMMVPPLGEDTENELSG